MDKLKSYREKIDAVDKKIVELILMRLDLAKKIGIYKKKNKIKITDKKRELQAINNIKKHSNKKNQIFIVNIFKKIIVYSKKIQK